MLAEIAGEVRPGCLRRAPSCAYLLGVLGSLAACWRALTRILNRTPQVVQYLAIYALHVAVHWVQMSRITIRAAPCFLLPTLSGQSSMCWQSELYPQRHKSRNALQHGKDVASFAVLPVPCRTWQPLMCLNIHSVHLTSTQDGEKLDEFIVPKIVTAPYDPRFPNANQARHCFIRYNEYYKCVTNKCFPYNMVACCVEADGLRVQAWMSVCASMMPGTRGATRVAPLHTPSHSLETDKT